MFVLKFKFNSYSRSPEKEFIPLPTEEEHRFFYNIWILFGRRASRYELIPILFSSQHNVFIRLHECLILVLIDSVKDVRSSGFDHFNFSMNFYATLINFIRHIVNASRIMVQLLLCAIVLTETAIRLEFFIIKLIL